MEQIGKPRSVAPLVVATARSPAWTPTCPSRLPRGARSLHKPDTANFYVTSGSSEGSPAVPGWAIAIVQEDFQSAAAIMPSAAVRRSWSQWQQWVDTSSWQDGEAAVRPCLTLERQVTNTLLPDCAIKPPAAEAETRSHASDNKQLPGSESRG